MQRETIKQLASTLDSAEVYAHQSVNYRERRCLQEMARDGQNEGLVVLNDGQRLEMQGRMAKAAGDQPQLNLLQQGTLAQAQSIFRTPKLRWVRKTDEEPATDSDHCQA